MMFPDLEAVAPDWSDQVAVAFCAAAKEEQKEAIIKKQMHWPVYFLKAEKRNGLDTIHEATNN